MNPNTADKAPCIVSSGETFTFSTICIINVVNNIAAKPNETTFLE